MKIPSRLIKLALVHSLFILAACGGGTGETVQPTGLSENIEQHAAVNNSVEQAATLGKAVVSLPRATAPSFPVFNAVQMPIKGKIDSYNSGMSEILMVYEDQLFAREVSHDQPDVAQIRKFALALKAGSVVCVDIERWRVNALHNPTMTREEIAANIQKYVTVATTIKSVAPTVKLGFYGTLPIRSYTRTLDDPTTPYYVQWQAENDALKPLADVVDVIFPSIYTHTTNSQIWQSFAEANIAEAKRYGKPVYPFLWPQYHDNFVAPFALQFIPQDYWQHQLATCRAHADGIVVWGCINQNSQFLEWDESAPWWLSLQNFLSTL